MSASFQSLPKLYFVAFIWVSSGRFVVYAVEHWKGKPSATSNPLKTKRNHTIKPICELVNQVDLGETGDFGGSGDSDWASAQFEPVLVDF
jgi:hypothetical protein